jgi:drug/metabolite transporter (DMT)-like permease
MTHSPKAFFATGAVFALAGMIWGIQMSATHDHTLSPAHGHLNLIGFVAMSVFGAYYALTRRAAASRLAGLYYLLTVATVLILVPGIVLAITERGVILAQIGSLLALASMALFTVIVLRHGAGQAQAAGPTGSAQPAE